jgi:hypothetical protein
MHPLELSLHTPPKSIVREYNHIFPSNPPTGTEESVVLPTIQSSTVGSLLSWDDTIAAEKDRLLESFVSFCTAILLPTLPPAVFLDYIDPCSGLPMLTTESTRIYDEVESFHTLLSYPVNSANGCKVFTHPKYGEGAYPATCFVVGDREVVLEWFRGIVDKYKV